MMVEFTIESSKDKKEKIWADLNYMKQIFVNQAVNKKKQIEDDGITQKKARGHTCL
jgi:hypothetical protein